MFWATVVGLPSRFVRVIVSVRTQREGCERVHRVSAALGRPAQCRKRLDVPTREPER